MTSFWQRFPPPLRISIPLLMLVFSLGFVTFNTWLLLRSDLRIAEDRVIDQAERTAARLAEMVSSRQGTNETDLKRELAFLGRDPRVHWAVICNQDQTIVFTTQTQEGWLGQPAASSLPPQAMALALRAARDRAPAFSTDHKQAAYAVRPLPSESDDPLQWLVIVEHDLTKAVAIAYRSARSQGLVSAGVHAAACLLLWLGLHQFFTRRTRQLLENARITEAGTALPEPLSGGDEFAELSRALRENQDRFHQLADNVGDLFFIFTRDRKVIYVNPAYETMWGRSIQRLMEDPESWKDYVLEEYVELLDHSMDPLMNGAAMTQCEYRIRHPDGSIRWIEGRLFPVKNAAGEVYRVAALCRDVTDRKASEQQMLNVSERERRNIGHDLHDDLCQRLAAIKLKCELFTDRLRRQLPPNLAQASEISSQIAEATSVCRNIARGLAPVDLEGDGLMGALGKLTKNVESMYEIPCFFYCPHSVMVDNPNAAVNLYRIAQELVNNAARHGNATRIDIRLEMNTESVRIEVLNDGVEFRDTPENRTGMGLKIIHYRVNAIGANVRISPRKDGIRGTAAVIIASHSTCNPN
jgi:PAS domain S-box-containing protein